MSLQGHYNGHGTMLLPGMLDRKSIVTYSSRRLGCGVAGVRCSGGLRILPVTKRLQALELLISQSQATSKVLGT